MSSDVLEKRYRTLLRAYPADYRRERADELIDTLLGDEPTTRRWPTLRQAAALIRGGLRVHSGSTAARPTAVLVWQGIHLGAMAGSIDAVQRTFAGLRMAGEELTFSPLLPKGLRSVRFTVSYRGQLLSVALDHQRLTVSTAPGSAAPVRIRIGATKLLLGAGQSHSFPLSPPS